MTMIRLAAAAALVASASAHGSVLFPPTRNSIDAQLEPWKSSSDNVREHKQCVVIVLSNSY